MTLSTTMDRYTVYILHCSDGSFYTGVTNDIERRMHEHQSGHDPKSYAFKRRPLEHAYQEHFHNIDQAIAWEKQVKGWCRRKKKALIKGEWDELPNLSRAYWDKRREE